MEEKERNRKTIKREMRKSEGNRRDTKEKVRNTILLREDLASLAVRNKWERKYRKALRDEDERITCVVAEKEARDEKILNEKIEVCAAIDAAIDRATKTFWTMFKPENEKKLAMKYIGKKTEQ